MPSTRRRPPLLAAAAPPAPWLAAALDAGCVLAFVVIGRASHTQGEALGGIASTAWPFLAALAVGWLAIGLPPVRGWRHPAALAPAGLTVWGTTVALGMAARVIAGQGTAVTFIVVALAFLGLFLLGWRLLWNLAAQLRATSSLFQ
jgi:hypothetical protein